MNVQLLTLICATVGIITKTGGFAEICDVNQILFVTSGSTATFRMNNLSEISVRHFHFRFNGRDLISRHLDVFQRYFSYSRHDTFYHDSDIEKRTRITYSRQNENQREMTIAVSDTSMLDNGNYEMYFERRKTKYCWTLNVMPDSVWLHDLLEIKFFIFKRAYPTLSVELKKFKTEINKEPRAILEEHRSVYLYGHPPASLVPNATMIWLFNGLFANQSGNFIEYDGLIWIALLRKDLFGRNITYRAVQDNGDINDVNFNLEFAYGPTFPLTLKPKKKHYFLKSGNVIPDINCSADCNPPCSVSWGKHSSGSTLSLGRVTIDNNGDYTCTAKRPDHELIVEETISVYVTDDTFVTIAVAVIGSVQACSILVLGFCAAWFYSRNKRALCQQSFKQKSSSGDGSVQRVDRKKSTQMEMDHYESLDPEN